MAKEQALSKYHGDFLSAGLSLLIVQFLAKSSSLWTSVGTEIPPTIIYAIASLFCLLDLYRARFNLKVIRLKPFGFSIGLVFILISDWPDRNYNIWLHKLTRGEIFGFSILLLLLIRQKAAPLLHILTPLTCVGLCYTFMSYLGGALIFSDDHATFLYRLHLLTSEFPNIPFYSPEWNGGYDARYFFATGALNIFTLASPLLYSFPVEQVYNLIIALLLFILVPASVYWGALRLGLRGTTPPIAALLALSSSLTWYRWGLSYGTLGFLTTAALFPLCLSLITRILSDEKPLSRIEAITTVAVTTLVVFWTPAGIALLPCILISLFAIHKLVKRRYIVWMGVALVLLNIPWMMLFWNASNVSRFLEKKHSIEMITQTTGAKNTTHVKKDNKPSLDLTVSKKVLREAASSTNPLIFIFLIPGIALIRGRKRWILLTSYAWLLVMGSILVPLKPQLELDRMLAVLFLAGSIPAAHAISELIVRAQLSQRHRYLGAISLGALFAAVLCMFSVAQNRSLIRFEKQGELVSKLSEAVMTHGGNGRVVFSGFMLHEFSGGHLAPLAYFTGKPIIASSQVHNLWKYKQVFPKEFISRGDEGIEEYLNLYNASSVVAHEKQWRDYFREKPHKYKEVWRYDSFSIFERLNYTPNYFMEGSGKIVKTLTDRVIVKLDSPNAVLKFNYFPFLRAKGCTVSGHFIASDIEFVKLTDCKQGVPITLESQSPFSRILGAGNT